MWPTDSSSTGKKIKNLATEIWVRNSCSQNQYFTLYDSIANTDAH
jgi:hypothetical protein